MAQDLLTSVEVAALLKVQPQTIKVWRHQRKGPAFIRVGRMVRYERAAVELWIKEQNDD